ncbi:MAG: type II toxin-antitoxin system VapC family toxin [Leptolyngbya sp. SIO4C1]|nr:type II toxin-antitoxin system VapC family toxin [Leptolyngbya sp. SIO4C1]
MRRLILDAGPLIGLLYSKDTYHSQCVNGFRYLSGAKTILLTPMPIVFEVYKWLLQRTRPAVAQRALETMSETLHILTLDSEIFSELKAAVSRLSDWHGSLEDATVILTAIQYRCPVWTYNFRDFNVFKSLELWTPESVR